jgi:hypothetical protein
MKKDIIRVEDNQVSTGITAIVLTVLIIGVFKILFNNSDKVLQVISIILVGPAMVYAVQKWIVLFRGNIYQFIKSENVIIRNSNEKVSFLDITYISLETILNEDSDPDIYNLEVIFNNRPSFVIARGRSKSIINLAEQIADLTEKRLIKSSGK